MAEIVRIHIILCNGRLKLALRWKRRVPTIGSPDIDGASNW